MAFSKLKRRNYKIGAIVLFIVAVLTFIIGFYDAKCTSKENIKSIKGTLRSYWFNDLNRGGHDYMINLNESNKSFHISADLITNFNKDKFERNIFTNDSLYLSYLKLPGIILPESNELVSLRSSTIKFLALESSYNKLVNHNILIKYLSFAPLIIGLLLLNTLRIDKKYQ
jgi:hypothetical protein